MRNRAGNQRVRARALLRAGALLGLVLLGPAPGWAETSLEAKVKAAYLFNLTRFVDWPSLPPDAVHICVLGNSAVAGLLLELSGRQVKERPLQIDINGDIELDSCQVLFISQGSEQWQEVVSQAGAGSVLTVSDLEDFARRGGMVGFYNEGGRIRLEINTAAAQAVNLKISSRLLELARTVP